MVAALLVLGLSAAAVAQSRKPRVFVFTATHPSGFVDAEQKERQDSVRDVQKALRGVQIVRAREEADLVLEIVLRTKDDPREVQTVGRSDGGDFAATSGRYSGRRLEARLTVPGTEYATQLVGVGWVSWGNVADELAKKFGRWLKDNRQHIPK